MALKPMPVWRAHSAWQAGTPAPLCLYYDDGMKRWSLRIFLFLILGAIVNVAVAWGCVVADLRRRGSTMEETDAESIVGRWLTIDKTGYELIDVNGMRFAALGWQLCLLEVNFVDRDVPLGDPRNDSIPLFVHNAGWPAMSLECAFSRKRIIFSRGGLAIPQELKKYPDDIRLLPTLPLWPGFAINTVFYAFILWLLFAAPFALRRRRRIRRGLCPKCAYPVGTSDVCTECGAAVRYGRQPRRMSA